MLESVPSRNTLYEIVAVAPLTSQSATYSVNAYMVFPNSPLRLYKGLFELVVDLQKKKVVFPVYNSLYTTVDYPRISYQVKKSALEASLPNLEKGAEYTSYIIKSIKEKCPDFVPPPRRLNYIIANGYYHGFEYFGIHHHLTNSRFLRTSYTVIDVSANGFYKHEIIHYVFSSYKLCRFLDEGMATFYSGELKYGTTAADELSAIKSRVKSDKKFATLLNNKDSLFDYSLKPEMYVIAALLIRNYYKKVGERKFYNVLFHDLISLSDEEVLQFFKKQLNIKQISDFILTTEEANWSEMYNHAGTIQLK